jgi:SAP domain
MAKVKYVGGESSDSFMDEPGTVKVKITRVTDRTDEELKITLAMEGISGSQKGKLVIDYLQDTPTAGWKFAEMLRAVGITMKEGQEIDTDRLAKQLMGKTLTVLTFTDTYNNEERIKVKNYLAPKKSSSAEDDPEDDDTDDDSDEPESNPAEAREEPEEEEVDLDEMDRGELRAFIKEQGLEVKILKSMSDDDIRTAIEAALGEEPEAESAQEGNDEEGYDDWSEDELKDECKTKGLSARGSKATLVKRLVEHDAADDDPFKPED